jgi:DNA polymerase III subunit delta'
VLPTIASRCQPVRFDPLPAAELAERLQTRGVAPETALACARLSLGDAERALAMALEPDLRARAEEFARAPLYHRPMAAGPLLDESRAAGARARATVEAALAEELEYLPKKEHRRRTTELDERARRAERRAATEALEHALQLAGLWYRDLACVAAGAEELVHNADRLDGLREDAALRDRTAWLRSVELVDDTRARLALNVSEALALEALAYRLEESYG